MERAILHSDLNCFYASVEMMLDPSLRGKAVAVCGSTEDRHGIVLAKSEKAKKAVVLVIHVIEIAVLLMLTYVAAQYVMNSWHRVTDVLMMPRWVFSIAVPIGFGWSLLYAIYFFVMDLLGKGKEEESHDTGVY